MSDNNRILKKVMDDHHLKIMDVVELTRAGSRHTVMNWLRDPTHSAYRTMPAASLELLLIKLTLGDHYTEILKEVDHER